MRSKPFPVHLLPILSLSDGSAPPSSPPRGGGGGGGGEYLDPDLLFGTAEILNGNSIITRRITTNTAVTPGWPELRHGETEVADPLQPSAKLESYTWRQHWHGLFQTPTPP